jgi:hypothetical protein
MIKEVVALANKAGAIMEKIIARGGLGKLNAEERGKFNTSLCESLGLNPLTKPIDYLKYGDVVVPYINKDGCAQLRANYGVSVTEMTHQERDGVHMTIVKVADSKGRSDIATGAVSIVGLKGEALANKLMHGETKAKNRATLSVCGLGFLSEEEVKDMDVEQPAPAAPRRAGGPPMPPTRPQPQPKPITQAEAEALASDGGDGGKVEVWGEDGVDDSYAEMAAK